MVGTKLIPAVETTPNKCRAIIEGERTAVKSQGITAVYRWDIFWKLDYPIWDLMPASWENCVRIIGGRFKELKLTLRECSKRT